MTIEETPLAIGDPIEVRMEMRTPQGPVEQWWPATITHINDREIGVAFANSMRLALQRHRGGYRRP